MRFIKHILESMRIVIECLALMMFMVSIFAACTVVLGLEWFKWNDIVRAILTSLVIDLGGVLLFLIESRI